MTTVARPLPAHGTLTRNKHYKCKCDTCLNAFRAYTRTRNRLKGYGTWQPFADAEPVRAHIATLRAAGISIPSIADAAGISNATLARILYGELGQRPAAKLRAESARAVLALHPEDCNIPDGTRIDATGVRRRVQALVAMGWSFTALGPQLGIHPRPLGDLARAQQVNAGTARKVKAGYRRLSTRLPEQFGVRPQARALALRVAQREGWVRPGAWDNIDDPAAVPDLGEATPRYMSLGEDGLWLESLGLTRQQAAERLEVSKDYLEKSINRYRAALGGQGEAA